MLQLSEENGVALSIVIINWNTRELLAGCLRSVYETASDPRFEVILVDNASTDGSAAMVRERFPPVRLIENRENTGFARANNQAIKQSQGRYILLLNSDTEVYQGALKTLVQFMDEHPQAGGCGPKLINPDDSLQPSCHPILTPERELWRLLFMDRLWHRATCTQERWSPETPHPVEVIKGASFLLRSSALEQVGLLDETYFMYTEEMDLCCRLLQAGWQLWWVPQAEVLHHGGASSKQAVEAMYVQLYRSKMQFHRKFGGSRRAARFRLFLRIAYWPRLIIASLAGLVSPSLAAQARTYRRLLTELPKM